MTSLIRERLPVWYGRGAKIALVVGLLTLAPKLNTPAQEPAKWSVPIRVLAAEKPDSDKATDGMMPPEMARPSAGLPPQYQTTKKSRVTSEPVANDASLRFIVTLIGQPILVEAQVTVDGKPFRQRREDRIDKLLQELSQPVPMPVAPVVEVASEAADPVAEANLAPQPVVDNSFLGKLRRYAEATKRAPSRDEVRWLLTNWADGPTLLLLDENYQRARANTSPLFRVLDRDEDRILSAVEIASAQDSLWKYDDNQDESLSLNEINKAAERTPDSSPEMPSIPPLIPVEQLDNPQTYQRLCEYYRTALSRFDRDGDGLVSQAELTELRSSTPDLQVLVAFDTTDASHSRLEVLATNQSLGDLQPTTRQTSLTLLCSGTLLELSAIQSQNIPAADQISLGAVRDGLPILPEVDANEDGRLTIRELRQVSQCLTAFDRDEDGLVAESEVLPTLRVSFGLGPIAHVPLAAVRTLHPAVSSPAATPPDWFARMDRNMDGDLTPREFLGGKEQFATLDADEDGLVSILEANASK